MSATLRDFLRTGRLGEIIPGLGERAMVALLGEASLTSGISADGTRIHRYGDVQLHTARGAIVLIMIKVPHGRLVELGDSCTVEDTAAYATMTPRALIDHLTANGLTPDRDRQHWMPADRQDFVLASGVRLSFEDGALSRISLGSPW